ncbi:MAG: winged helix-turn-helix transcriptional regulator [Nanoarchaeota archaeon]
MINNEAIKNIWELYGVNENPFSTSPILVIGGTIPIESFVGRKEHIERLSKILGSKGGSRTFVYGDIGIGKTSFANVVRASLLDKGFFTHFKEITVQETWNADDFILNTLSAIYATLKLLREKPISNNSYKKLESLFEIGKTTVSGGLSIAGFGGNYRSEQATERLPSFSLHQFFGEIIDEITNQIKKEVVIHYNNLELLPEKKLRQFFDNLRDFFQTKNVHFIFIGNLTAYAILQSVQRFSSILTDTPFHLETLKYEEVKEIIKKRFERLRISKEYNVISPFTDDCLQVLYKLMDGNIRDILNSLSTAVFHATTERPVILDRNKLAKTLKDILEKRYLSSLTPRAREVLNEIVKHDEITNKALSDKLKIPRSNISSYIKDLENSGCVYLRRKNGKDKFWRADSKIKWSLLKENPQQVLTSGLFETQN